MLADIYAVDSTVKCKELADVVFGLFELVQIKEQRFSLF